MAGVGDRLLFAGILQEVQIAHERAVYHVKLTGISATEQLDHSKQNRSFQNISMTYGEVMRQVLADTPGAKLMNLAWISTIPRRNNTGERGTAGREVCS